MANFAADDERVDTDIRQVKGGNSIGGHTANSATISSKPPGRSMICVSYASIFGYVGACMNNDDVDLLQISKCYSVSKIEDPRH